MMKRQHVQTMNQWPTRIQNHTDHACMQRMINFIQATVYCRLHDVRGHFFCREMESQIDAFVSKKLELRVVVLLGVCHELHVIGGKVGCKSLHDL